MRKSAISTAYIILTSPFRLIGHAERWFYRSAEIIHYVFSYVVLINIGYIGGPKV